MPAIIPIPKIPVSIRPATMDDLPFIDALQKTNTFSVGFLHRKAMEAKIGLGQVLVAEEGPSTGSGRPASPLGYCIGQDQYFKRDDVGIIYQLNVVPGNQRSLVGATLIKAMFERAAWGCRLFCCWCAQDLDANYFWEALGFVPLAFRTGCQKRQRIHIFWQRRIRENDQTTPYWFQSQTKSGAFREDRLVLPIPPGTHWRDAKPIILPGTGAENPRQLPSPKSRSRKEKAAVFKPAAITSGGLRFALPKDAAAEPKPGPKPKREPKQKVKNDPKFVAAARELRDRWLERVNADPSAIGFAGKYDIARALPEAKASVCIAEPTPHQLPAAA